MELATSNWVDNQAILEKQLHSSVRLQQFSNQPEQVSAQRAAESAVDD
jgi:hypothetical protein